jgi:hypothetical protein
MEHTIVTSANSKPWTSALRVRTGVKAGGMPMNHNETALRVRSVGP